MNRSIAAALVVAVGMLTACSNSEPATNTGTAAEGTPAAISAGPSDAGAWLNPDAHVAPIITGTDRQDPADVGQSVAEIACLWSPILDTTETDALLRAAPLLTPQYADAIIAPQRGASQAVFLQAADAQAVSIPTATRRTDIADAPPSTETTQYLAYAVTWTWTTAEQQTAAVEDNRIRTVYVVLDRQADGTWLVSHVDYQDQHAVPGASPNS